jgi:hypothetical protein
MMEVRATTAVVCTGGGARGGVSRVELATISPGASSGWHPRFFPVVSGHRDHRRAVGSARRANLRRQRGLTLFPASLILQVSRKIGRLLT